MKKYTIHWILCGTNWRYNEICCYNECRYKKGSLYFYHIGLYISGGSYTTIRSALLLLVYLELSVYQCLEANES